MKKTLFFGIIAASLGFTACSSEDDAILGENTQKKGIVLKAAVDQPAETRASINTSGTWRFSFTNGDGLKVNNTEHAAFYDFSTTDGAEFSCDNAFTTTDPATWYAYYPSESISLLNQTGNIADVARYYYALAGATTAVTDGADGLNISMKPQVAILQIRQYWDECNIQVKTSDTKYVTGLSAKSGEAAFDVETSNAPSTLFSTSSNSYYYVAVPAGKQISIKDDDVTIKSTGVEGLTAGKYYVLSLGQIDISLDNGMKLDNEHMVFQAGWMTVTLTLSSDGGESPRFNEMGDIQGEEGTLTITIDDPSGMKIKKIIAVGWGGNQTLTGPSWDLNITGNQIETIGRLDRIKVLYVE